MPRPTAPGYDWAFFRLDRTTRIMLGGAAIWTLGLVAAALTVPFYRGRSTSGSTSVGSGGTSATITTSSPATLVQVNGFRVLVPVAIPFLAVVLVAVALSRRRKAHKTGPGPMASVVVALLGAGTIVAILSVGIFVVPADALSLAVLVRASNLGSHRGGRSRAKGADLPTTHWR
jgi:hypothetical protein